MGVGKKEQRLLTVMEGSLGEERYTTFENSLIIKAMTKLSLPFLSKCDTLRGPGSTKCTRDKENIRTYY